MDDNDGHIVPTWRTPCKTWSVYCVFLSYVCDVQQCDVLPLLGTFPWPWMTWTCYRQLRMSLCVLAGWPFRHGSNLRLEEMDLMQRSSASSAPFRFNIEAREFIPEAVRLLRQQPEVVQDLHALWDPVACAWEDEPRAGRILSWFVDQERGPEVCNEPRTVVLCDDVTRWLDDICKAWLDHLTMGAEIEYHLVSPQPPQLEPNIIAHVIIVQNPSVQRVTPLVTILIDGTIQIPTDSLVWQWR